VSQIEHSPPTGLAEDQGGLDPRAKASEIAGQAHEKAQQAAGNVQDRLRDQLDQRSSQAATQITDQASDLRAVGQILREQGKDGPAKLADQLAQYAEKAGGYLRDKDSHALLRDAEDFGRRQPWAIAAGGVALGFAASRFLKASSSERYQRLTVERPAGVYSRPPSIGNGTGERQRVGSAGLDRVGSASRGSGAVV
jgi:hypothetical protein